MSHVPRGAETYAMTDQGRVRPRNEDQFLVATLAKTVLIEQTSLAPEDHTRLIGPPQGLLLVVADGMGGHKGGSIASAVAVDAMMTYVLTMMPWFFRLDVEQEDDLREELAAAIGRAQALVKQAGSMTSKPDMGAALTMAYVLWPRAYVVHAGDTRCYLSRAGRLQQITKDHTLGRQLQDRGVAQSEDSPWSRVLWNAVGGPSDALLPEVHKVTLEPADVLLLCSDGLSRHVPDHQIARTLEHSSPKTICEGLIRQANDDGGSDNTTVVCARCD